MPDPMTFVVAATHRRFVNWCRDNNLHPSSRALHYVGPDDWWTIRHVMLRRGIDHVIDIGGDAEVMRLMETRYRA